MVHVGLLRIYSGFIYGRLMVLEVIEADLGVFSPAGWIKDYLQNVFRHQSHQRTEGPRDQKTRGPRDRRRTKGPKDQGTRGPRDQGTKGPENQGTRGPRERTEGPGDSKTTRFENCIKGPKHCTSAGKMNIFLGIPYFFFDALNVFFWCLIFFLEPHASSSQLQEGRKRESVDGIAGRWRQFDGPAGCSHDKMFPNVWCMWKASWSPGEQRWTSASQSAWCTCQDATRTHWGESVSHPKQYCQLCATVVPSGAPIKGDGARFSSVAGQLRKQNGVQHRPPAPRPGQQECVQPSARRCQHRQHSTF